MNLMVVVQEMRCADEMVIDQINERNANVCGAQNALDICLTDHDGISHSD